MKMRCKKCNRKLNTDHRTITCSFKDCKYASKHLAEVLEFKDYPKDKYDIVSELTCKQVASKFSGWSGSENYDSYGYGCGI